MSGAEIIPFPGQEEDHAERLSQRPPFTHTDGESALIVDENGNQSSPEHMTDGMQLLDLFESEVTHDGYGPEAYAAWLNEIERLRNLGKSATNQEVA